MRHREHFADRLTGNFFFDVEAALFVGIEEDVHFIHATEKIMDVAHDVLICASQEDAEVVGFVGTEIVKGKRFANIVEIDVFRDFAVGIAGDVDEGRLELRTFIEPMNRNDREELSECPMIEQRLKDGEVADVLIGELDLQRAQFFGHFAGIHAANECLHPLGDLPEQRLDARFDVEIEDAVLEHRLRLLFDLLQIMPRLGHVVFGERAIGVEDLANEFVIGGADRARLERRFFDRAECLHGEDGMMRDDGAA